MCIAARCRIPSCRGSEMAVRRPRSIEALCAEIQAAAANGKTLAIRGGGSKSAIGAPGGNADMRST